MEDRRLLVGFLVLVCFRFAPAPPRGPGPLPFLHPHFGAGVGCWFCALAIPFEEKELGMRRLVPFSKIECKLPKQQRRSSSKQVTFISLNKIEEFKT